MKASIHSLVVRIQVRPIPVKESLKLIWRGKGKENFAIFKAKLSFKKGIEVPESSPNGQLFGGVPLNGVDGGQ